MTINPPVGWAFTGWSGVLFRLSKSASITVMGNMAVKATFTQNMYQPLAQQEAEIRLDVKENGVMSLELEYSAIQLWIALSRAGKVTQPE